jgi:hypothetical protein
MIDVGRARNIVCSFLRSSMLLISNKFLHREPMFTRKLKQFRPQALLTFLVVLGLIFAGVRVPDLSRPHQPKPTHRVVLEKPHKSASNHLKQCGDLIAVVPTPPAFSRPISYHAELHVVSPRYVSHQFFPRSGRSPPVSFS